METSKTFFFIVCLLVLYDFHDNIVFPLTVRLIENAVCQRHFNEMSSTLGPIHESQCKTTAIQSQVAFIRGWYSLFRTVPAILAGPYFGSLTDRWARRPVYAIALTGLLLQLGAFYAVCSSWPIFPAQVSWTTGVLVAIGGGQFVIIGVNLAMVADISKPEERSQQLYIAFAIRFVADLVSPQVASSALQYSLWLPSVLAASVLVASYPILIIMDEPLHVKPASDGDSVDNTVGSPSSNWKRLLTDWRVILCLGITFLLQFRYMSQSIFISYVSVRFDWSIAQVFRLMSIIPGVSLLVFLGLPALHKTLSKRLTEPRQSYIVTQALVSALIIGDALIAAATGIPLLICGLAIFAIGDGVRAPLLAVASSFIDTDHETARLFTLMSITDAFAHTIGDPLLQTVWKSALTTEEGWLALPFVVSLGVFILAFFLTWVLPIKNLTSDTPALQGPEECRPLIRANDHIATTTSPLSTATRFDVSRWTEENMT